MTRRHAIGLLSAAAGAAPPARDEIRRRLPSAAPPGVAAIIADTLAQPPSTLNTDWFGTLLIKGLLEWGRKHVPEARAFAKSWFDYHLASGRVAPYSGAKSRTVDAGGIPITTYAGHWGLALPCLELADVRARAVALGVADVVLHQVARNRLGMVAHDDFADFAIPDTCFFAVSALMAAARLDPPLAGVYRRQAVYQLRTYLDSFLDRETGLAKTVLLPGGLGKTFWSRATGWLLWSVTAVLRDLSPADVAYAGLVRDLRALAAGIARAQDASGGLHLYVNEPDSPPESTGTAMCAMGLHEALRRRWLSPAHRQVIERAWSFVTANITPEGELRRAYTLWAIPAERRQVEIDGRKMAWIPGFVLSAAYELTAA